jgi:hypothetical protein
MQYVICVVVALITLTILFERHRASSLAKEAQRLRDDAALRDLSAARPLLERDLTDAQKDRDEKVREFRDRVGRFLPDDDAGV